MSTPLPTNNYAVWGKWRNTPNSNFAEDFLWHFESNLTFSVGDVISILGDLFQIDKIEYDYTQPVSGGTNHILSVRNYQGEKAVKTALGTDVARTE